ncbi:MAG: hypothetical protein HQK84_04810 [Nitrospinae bacterium]|nr:hypothetical protein [Nitrospinota bacterium]
MNESINEELKKLSYAILKSIIKSEEIHVILRDIVKKGEIASDTPLILVMELKQIRNILEQAESQDKEIIEGQVVSSEEAGFVEFCNDEFNEEEWLNMLRITLK